METNNELTEKQKKIYKSIKAYIKEHKISPTVRELCELNGLKSPATVHDYLERLKEKGYITYIKHSGRSIVILKKKKKKRD